MVHGGEVEAVTQVPQANLVDSLPGSPGAFCAGNAPATSVALPKKVKQPIVCHPERSEGSLQLFSP